MHVFLFKEMYELCSSMDYNHQSVSICCKWIYHVWNLTCTGFGWFSHSTHFFWLSHLHYWQVIMELNITMEGNGTVEKKNVKKSMDLKLVQSHWKMMITLAVHKWLKIWWWGRFIIITVFIVAVVIPEINSLTNQRRHLITVGGVL